MQLSGDRAVLAVLDDALLGVAILERRYAIRHHRDQRGDDRCWVDDNALWLMVAGLVTAPIVPFEYDAVMQKCGQFYHCRRAEHPDPIPADAIIDPCRWNDDLATMTHDQLLDELVRIQATIASHYAIQDRSRTADDDRALYSVLPEKIPADLRLPPEDHFLGETKSPDAGCPAFWRSHDGCGPDCNPHQWGPCKKS